MLSGFKSKMRSGEPGWDFAAAEVEEYSLSIHLHVEELV